MSKAATFEFGSVFGVVDAATQGQYKIDLIRDIARTRKELSGSIQLSMDFDAHCEFPVVEDVMTFGYLRASRYFCRFRSLLQLLAKRSMSLVQGRMERMKGPQFAEGMSANQSPHARFMVREDRKRPACGQWTHTCHPSLLHRLLELPTAAELGQ